MQQWSIANFRANPAMEWLSEAAKPRRMGSWKDDDDDDDDVKSVNGSVTFTE